MTNILQRTFKGAVGLAVLLAVMTIGSSPAWAQICQATSKSETVRAEGITEIVGTITLECITESSQTGFGLAADDDVEISIQLNTDITNNVSSAGMVANERGTATTVNDAAIPANQSYTNGGIAVYATQSDGSSTLTGSGEFDDFVLSRDGTEMTVEVTATQANLVGLPSTATGFDLVIAGIRANASAVGHSEDVMATVSVNGVVARRSPSKVADVTTGLSVEATRQNGDMCEVPESGDMATIMVKEAFMTALQAGHVLTVTFSDVPDGAMIVVDPTVGGGEETASTGTGVAPTIAASLTLTTGGIGSGVTRIRSGPNARKYMVDLSPTGTGAIIYTYSPGTMDAGGGDASTTAVNRDESTQMFDVPVKFLWEAGAVDTGRAWVNVSYSPVLSVRQGTIPRYVASSESPEVLRVASCDESLMFPFLTNQHGFDTGVALTNPTDMDGSCTIEFVAGGRVAMTETMRVGAMSTITFGLSQTAPDFQGHAEAACSFTGGSAFVFIANGAGPMGTPTAAQGYTVEAKQ